MEYVISNGYRTDQRLIRQGAICSVWRRFFIESTGLLNYISPVIFKISSAVSSLLSKIKKVTIKTNLKIEMRLNA